MKNKYSWRLVGVLMLTLAVVAGAQLFSPTVGTFTGVYQYFADGAVSWSSQLNGNFKYLDGLEGFPAQQVGSTGSALNGTLASKAAGSPVEALNSSLAATTTTQSAATIFTPTFSGDFRLSVWSDQTVLGASCAGNTTSIPTLTWQDPAAAAGQTQALATFTVTTNGTLGTTPYTSGLQNYQFRAKAGAVIQLTNTISPGGSCTPVPTTQLYYVLEAL